MNYKTSYDLHENVYLKYQADGEQSELGQTWLNYDTVDAWRHKRMYQTIDALLSHYTDAKWLTIGDGRYANDANYIHNKGVKVVASDISDCLLKAAKQLGRIDEYKKENAEALSFDNNSFDFTLCKESYHHFPRPMIALYEMLRVAKKGVVLIEPNDPCSSCRNPDAFWEIVMRQHCFEEVGNYVYFISPRELIKVAIGISLPTIAFKEFNDVYFEGVEYEKASPDSKLFQKIKEGIAEWDNLCAETHRPSTSLTAIMFKEIPDLATREALIKQGFKVIDLPKSPKF